MLDILSKLDFKISNGQVKLRGKIVDSSTLGGILATKLGSDHPAVSKYYEKYSGPERTKNLLSEFVSKYQEGEEVDPSTIIFEDLLPYTFDQIKIFVDQKPSNLLGVIYPSGKIDFWAANVVQDKLKKLGDSVGRYKETNFLSGQRGYFPGKAERFFLGDDEVKYLNRWVAPSWMSCDLPTYQVEKFTEFMNFVFSDEKDFKMGHAWVRRMVDSRAGCVLIFSGTPGFGKNFFAERICKALVGKDNYLSASRGEGDGGKFHAGVDECKLRYYDELQLQGAMRDDIKSFMNDYATIERKGVDLDGPKAMHASFIIANNKPKEVELEVDDRKFWAPKLPKMPLHERFSQLWIDEFVEELKSDQALKSIYEMCGEVGAGVDTRFPHKTEQFYEYCYNGLPYIIQEIITKLEDQPIITNSDLTKRSKMEPYEIRDFLTSYGEKRGKPIADFYDMGKGRYRLTRPGVKPEDIEKTI